MLRVLIWLSLVVYSIALIGALASGNHHIESITIGSRQKTLERMLEKR